MSAITPMPESASAATTHSPDTGNIRCSRVNETRNTEVYQYHSQVGTRAHLAETGRQTHDGTMLTLHIGLPKTGTTFLQHRVLAQAEGIDFIHRDRGPTELGLCLSLRRLAHSPPMLAPLLRLDARRRLAALRTKAAGLLVSDENISVHPRRFWHGAGPSPEDLARRLAGFAAKLPTSLRPLRIIIGIRRQDQWLASRYAESSRDFAEFGQADFDRRIAAIARSPVLPGPLGWLDFDRVQRTFATTFGSDNLLILPLERLVATPEPVFAELSRFLGAQIDRPAPAPKTKAERRQRNQLSSGENRWRMRRDKTELRLDPPEQAALLDRLAASNTALGGRIPLGF